MMGQVTFKDWVSQALAMTEDTLDRVLPAAHHPPVGLHLAMRYAVLHGGKRIRPLLLYACAEIVNAPLDRAQYAAAAVEMIHAFSLVHDDMPAMDNDTLRRGKPTCHIAYGEAQALLVGDALQTLAFEVLAKYTLTHHPANQLKMITLLAQASGSLGMCGGQSIDIEHIGQVMSLPELEQMHTLKTGALIRACVLLGSLCGDSLPDEARSQLDHYAQYMGLAFQIVDDILDCEADAATLGKTAGKDATNDKPTYVSLLGLPEAKRKVRELQTQALSAIACFGQRKQRLVELSHFIVDRQL